MSDPFIDPLTNDERQILDQAERRAGVIPGTHGRISHPDDAARVTNMLLVRLIYELQFLSGTVQGEIMNRRG
jgi:hypothetical protein